MSSAGDAPVVLVLDDDAQSVRLREKLFKNMGFTVLTAMTFKQALAEVNRRPDVDVALVDIRLTADQDDRSGIEVARRLRALEDPPLIVGYSGYIDKESLSGIDAEAFTELYLKAELNANDVLQQIDFIRELAVARRLTRGSASLREDEIASLIPVRSAWDEVCRYVASRPEHLHQLDPRRFEGLVGEMFHSYGFSVELTARTRDGGYDIIAVKNEGLTDVRFLIEAKRWSPDRPVGVAVVRALYGLRASAAASKLILATSSTVSQDSKAEFSRVIPWELDFIERDRIIEWCKEYPRIRLLGRLES